MNVTTTRPPVPTGQPESLPKWAVAIILSIAAIIVGVFGGALLLVWPFQTMVVLGCAGSTVAITLAAVFRVKASA